MPSISSQNKTISLQKTARSLSIWRAQLAKGKPSNTRAAPFPFPYQDDFESYKPGSTPRFFSDQKGSFEVVDEAGHGKCLKQIVPMQGIMWGYMQGVVKPYTVIGDDAWTDFVLSAHVRIAGGDVELGGRFNDPTNCLTAGFYRRTERGNSTTSPALWPRALSTALIARRGTA